MPHGAEDFIDRFDWIPITRRDVQTCPGDPIAAPPRQARIFNPFALESLEHRCNGRQPRKVPASLAQEFAQAGIAAQLGDVAVRTREHYHNMAQGEGGAKISG